MKVAGKAVLLTGAGKGLGRELARLFAAAGATVFVTDRNTNLVEEVPYSITTALMAHSLSRLIYLYHSTVSISLILQHQYQPNILLTLSNLLSKLCEELHKKGQKAHAFVLDVTDQARVMALKEFVLARGGVDILVNNAGVVFGGEFQG